MECRFDHVVRKNLADAEGVLRQYGDDFLQRNDFYVFLDASVLSACKMALIRNPRCTRGFSGRANPL
jgi:hypothetical protein